MTITEIREVDNLRKAMVALYNLDKMNAVLLQDVYIHAYEQMVIRGWADEIIVLEFRRVLSEIRTKFLKSQRNPSGQKEKLQ